MRRINSHLLPVFTLIVVCVLAHVCLLLAYRHGIAFPDSISYLLSAKALLAWESASSDWMRTPLVGLVLLLGQGMPNTGLPIFLLCALLFSFSIVLFYVFACELLKSRLAAFAAAFAVLLLQCTFFWTLFGAVWLLSDALYADLLFLGVLLLLLGMAKNNPYFLVPGSFVFGTAAALRPGSFIIFLFWLPILIIVARNSRLWLASTCVCIAVFFAPSAAWAFHQWSVYGVVGTQAFGQYLLLIRTLSLVQPGDRVFADPEDNKKFLRIVEESRRKHGDSFEAYIYQSGIASWLHTFTPDGRLPHQPDRVRQSIRANFQMRSLETRMAFRIISLHPGTYVRGVLQRYLLLFNPFKGYELFRPPFTDPQDIYPWVSVILSPDIEQAFYPPDGTVHAGPRDGIFLSVFPGTFVLPVIRPFFTRHLFTPAAFIHIFFALAFSAAYVVRKKRPAMFRVSVFASLFFLNAVLQYILIAIVHEPYERYAMMGELSLNAAGVLCVFALFVDRFRPTPSLSVQRSASTSLPPPSRTVVVR